MASKEAGGKLPAFFFARKGTLPGTLVTRLIMRDDFPVKTPVDYSQKIDRLRDECPVRAAIDVIRGRWKPSILWELNNGTKRFSDLQGALPGVTAQALTVQLRQLEADGVILREIFAEIPTRVEYRLSESGKALSGVMDQLEVWGLKYVKETNP